MIVNNRPAHVFQPGERPRCLLCEGDALKLSDRGTLLRCDCKVTRSGRRRRCDEKWYLLHVDGYTAMVRVMRDEFGDLPQDPRELTERLWDLGVVQAAFTALGQVRAA